MSKVSSIRIDDDVKEAAKKIAADMGLSLSAIINSYLKQIISTRSISIFAPEVIDADIDARLKLIDAEPNSAKFNDARSLVKSLED